MSRGTYKSRFLNKRNSDASGYTMYCIANEQVRFLKLFLAHTGGAVSVQSFLHNLIADHISEYEAEMDSMVMEALREKQSGV